MARFFAEAGERVCVTAREIPEIAGIEVVNLGSAGGIDDRGADAPLEDKSPFRRRRVPVQLARDARLKPHRYAGDSLRDRQLLDGRFLAEASAVDLAGRFLERELAVGLVPVRNKEGRIDYAQNCRRPRSGTRAEPINASPGGRSLP
jgi:hypothetical protein